MKAEDHPRAMHKATRAIHMGKLKEGDPSSNTPPP